MNGRILILEPMPAPAGELQKTLSQAGHDAIICDTAESLLARVQERPTDLVMIAAAEANAQPQLVTQIREASDEVQLIVMTNHGELQNAITSLDRRAFSFIAVPIDADHLHLLVQRGIEYVHLLRENNAFRNGKLANALAGSNLADLERQVILSTLERFKGHRLRTATALGIGLRTLGMKLKRWKEEGQLVETRS